MAIDRADIERAACATAWQARENAQQGATTLLSKTPKRNYLRTHRPTMPLAPLQLTLPFWKTGGPPTSLQIADTITSLSSQAVMSSVTSNARKLEGPASPLAPLAPGAPEGARRSNFAAHAFGSCWPLRSGLTVRPSDALWTSWTGRPGRARISVAPNQKENE